MKTAGRTFFEALLLLGLSSAVGLTVNAERQAGLDLSRDFTAGRTADTNTSPDAGTPARGADKPQHPFQTVSLEEARDYFGFADSSVLFIDARADDAYERCRIPNAIQFNPYLPKRYVQTVLDYAADAQFVIVYCNGGTCEDSVLAAQYLTEDLDPPLPFDHVYIFEGGIQAWYQDDQPREPENCQP